MKYDGLFATYTQIQLHRINYQHLCTICDETAVFKRLSCKWSVWTLKVSSSKSIAGVIFHFALDSQLLKAQNFGEKLKVSKSRDYLKHDNDKEQRCGEKCLKSTKLRVLWVWNKALPVPSPSVILNERLTGRLYRESVVRNARIVMRSGKVGPCSAEENHSDSLHDCGGPSWPLFMWSFFLFHFLPVLSRFKPKKTAKN